MDINISIKPQQFKPGDHIRFKNEYGCMGPVDWYYECETYDFIIVINEAPMGYMCYQNHSYEMFFIPYNNIQPKKSRRKSKVWNNE